MTFFSGSRGLLLRWLLVPGLVTFVGGGLAGTLIAWGGCPDISRFDVLEPATGSQDQFLYPNGSGAAVIKVSTPNSNNTTAGVMLSGFPLRLIRDHRPKLPPYRPLHLMSIWRCWGQGPLGPVTGTDPAPQFANVLGDNYPNPFNPVTTIAYSIKEPGHVALRIYNVAGQLVRTLVNERQAPRVEMFTVEWDGRNDAGHAVSSGVYFYKLSAKGFEKTKKMVLLK